MAAAPFTVPGRPYSHDGYRAGGKRTSMKIVPSDDAGKSKDTL